MAKGSTTELRGGKVGKGSFSLLALYPAYTGCSGNEDGLLKPKPTSQTLKKSSTDHIRVPWDAKCPAQPARGGNFYSEQLLDEAHTINCRAHLGRGDVLRE